MKNKLLKDLWNYQDGFSETSLCWRESNTSYLDKYHDKLPFVMNINPQGFRSGYDFLNLPDNTFKIGFFGCSVTNGVGLCEEHIWSDMFTKEFNKRYNKNAIGLNFGKAGCSNDYIAWNIEKVLEEIDLDLVCVMFTTTNRRTFAKPHSDVWSLLPTQIKHPFVNIINNPRWGPVVNKEVSPEDFNCLVKWMFSDENDHLNLHNNIRLCEKVLSDKRVPFLFNKLYEGYDKAFESSISINTLQEEHEAMTSLEATDLSQARALDWDVEDKSGHHGIVFHKMSTEKFLKQYEDNINKTT